MAHRDQVEKPPVTPIFTQEEPNQPIDLGQVPVQFDFQGKTFKEVAQVTMTFLPQHRLKFTVSFAVDVTCLVLSAWQDKKDVVSLTLTERDVTFDCHWATHDGNMILSPTRSAIAVTRPCSAISTATFHVFNFPDFQGPHSYILLSGTPPHHGFKTCGRAILKAGGWIVTIAATDRTDELAKCLKAQGGYVITHVGQIVREDGATFTSNQLDDLWTCLHYFLSFTLGCWAGIALPIGLDADGNRVYEEWGMGRTAPGPWKSYCSWFPPECGNLLSEVFPGFWSLWNRDPWRTPLAHALYWYIGACKGGAGIGVDTGLILAQTALELLAWNYCVQDQKIVSEGAFAQRGLVAADKLRLLASSMGIPREIPTDLSALRGQSGKQWEDAMEALTEIRNSLVHPVSKLKLSDGSCWEAYMLSLWFINLVLLRLCGHNGVYANILPTSDIVTVPKLVPWCQKQTDYVE